MYRTVKELGATRGEIRELTPIAIARLVELREQVELRLNPDKPNHESDHQMPDAQDHRL